METTVKTYSLADLASSITTVLERTYTNSYWVSAEILKLNYYTKTGHCYPELVEKKDGVIVAEMRSTIWKATYEQINQKFFAKTKLPLRDGMEVLFLVQVKFDAKYGLSLNIVDVDPTYTLGALALEKQASIEELKKLGVFDANKMLSYPTLPNRIAIISVETSKGYHDYLNTIADQGSKFNIQHTLFPAVLQGDNAITSITKQLGVIAAKANQFDLVLIIRGGGGDVGLHCYNHFELAKAVATFPIPVITGIGHSTNFTVTEMVAHINKITPTAVASHVVQQFVEVDEFLEHATHVLSSIPQLILQPTHQQLRHLSSKLKNAVTTPVNAQRIQIKSAEGQLAAASKTMIHQQQDLVSNTLKTKLNTHSTVFLRQQQMTIDHLQEKLTLVDPKKVMERGYSLTYANNKVVNAKTPIKKGDALTTLTANNTITSTVINIDKNE